MAETEYTAKFSVDVSDLKKGISDATTAIRQANAEFKASTAGMDSWTKSSDGLAAKLKQLASNLENQKSILSAYREELKKQEEGYAENGRRAEELKNKLADLAANGIGKTDAEYKKYEASLKSVLKEQENNGKAAENLRIKITNQEAAINKTEASIRKYTAAQQEQERLAKSLNHTVDEQRQKLDQLKKAYADALASDGKNAKTTRELAKEIKTLANDLNKNESELKKNTDAANQLDGSFQKTEASTGKFAAMLGGGLKAGLAAAAAGLAAMGAAVIKLGTEAIKNYADYEQLVGGIETLFGAGGKSLEEYAQSVGKTVDEAQGEYNKLMNAQDTVLKNAGEAYKNAGLSANEYMETVTSFSASLIQSLGGDTEKAADYANRAIVDMSDNANKMGTDISMIQNAYGGFAKQTFTMLDNLKLGYNGTKTEMERLIADAAKLTDVQKELGVSVEKGSLDFGNIVNAISVIQANLGIAGTTANEAATTISGSLNSLKAAWSNVLTAVADDTADFDSVIGGLVDSLMAFIGNIVPRIQTTLGGVSKLITALVEQILPPILAMLPDVISNLLPVVQSAFSQVLQALISSAPQLTQALFDLLNGATDALISALPQLLAVGMQIAGQLAQGLAENAPALMNAAINAFLLLVDTFLDPANLDTMIDAGLELILSLATGLAEAAPRIVEKIPSIIIKIFDAIVRNLPKIVESGVLLLEALIQGILETVGSLGIMIADLIERVKNWWNAIDWGELGKNLIDGIVSGITQWASNLWERVKSLASEAVSRMKSALGIASPSKVFANQVGKNIPLGIVEGIKKTAPKLEQAVKGLASDLPELSVNAGRASAIRRGIGWVNGVSNELQQNSAGVMGMGNMNTTNNSRVQNFYQTINAPKQPSRIELYRQTRNLLTYAGIAGGL